MFYHLPHPLPHVTYGDTGWVTLDFGDSHLSLLLCDTPFSKPRMGHQGFRGTLWFQSKALCHQSPCLLGFVSLLCWSLPSVSTLSLSQTLLFLSCHVLWFIFSLLLFPIPLWLCIHNFSLSSVLSSPLFLVFFSSLSCLLDCYLMPMGWGRKGGLSLH